MGGAVCALSYRRHNVCEREFARESPSPSLGAQPFFILLTR
jgi:hypothetical protein